MVAVSTRHAGQIAAAARSVSRGHSAPERSASRSRQDQHVTRPGNNIPYILSIVIVTSMYLQDVESQDTKDVRCFNFIFLNLTVSNKIIIKHKTATVLETRYVK